MEQRPTVFLHVKTKGQAQDAILLSGRSSRPRAAAAKNKPNLLIEKETDCELGERVWVSEVVEGIKVHLPAIVHEKGPSRIRLQLQVPTCYWQQPSASSSASTSSRAATPTAAPAVPAKTVTSRPPTQSIFGPSATTVPPAPRAPTTSTMATRSAGTRNPPIILPPISPSPAADQNAKAYRLRILTALKEDGIALVTKLDHGFEAKVEALKKLLTRTDDVRDLVAGALRFLHYYQGTKVPPEVLDYLIKYPAVPVASDSQESTRVKKRSGAQASVPSSPLRGSKRARLVETPPLSSPESPRSSPFKGPWSSTSTSVFNGPAKHKATAAKPKGKAARPEKKPPTTGYTVESFEPSSSPPYPGGSVSGTPVSVADVHGGLFSTQLPYNSMVGGGVAYGSGNDTDDQMAADDARIAAQSAGGHTSLHLKFGEPILVQPEPTKSIPASKRRPHPSSLFFGAPAAEEQPPQYLPARVLSHSDHNLVVQFYDGTQRSNVPRHQVARFGDTAFGSVDVPLDLAATKPALSQLSGGNGTIYRNPVLEARLLAVLPAVDEVVRGTRPSDRRAKWEAMQQRGRVDDTELAGILGGDPYSSGEMALIRAVLEARYLHGQAGVVVEEEPPLALPLSSGQVAPPLPSAGPAWTRPSRSTTSPVRRRAAVFQQKSPYLLSSSDEDVDGDDDPSPPPARFQRPSQLSDVSDLDDPIPRAAEPSSSFPNEATPAAVPAVPLEQVFTAPSPDVVIGSTRFVSRRAAIDEHDRSAERFLQLVVLPETLLRLLVLTHLADNQGRIAGTQVSTVGGTLSEIPYPMRQTDVADHPWFRHDAVTKYKMGSQQYNRASEWATRLRYEAAPTCQYAISAEGETQVMAMANILLHDCNWVRGLLELHQSLRPVRTRRR
ncbi:hypothetical protein BC828DRAFT_402283 [Blastocladiella britannica]|nr:hypothetical protein BC828DRAFT_402283 [Blastocladiella britannica]